MSNPERLFYSFVILVVAVAVLVMALRRLIVKRKLTYKTRLTEADLQRLYSLALRSQSHEFVNMVIYHVEMNWGDGMEHRRLKKHLWQGINEWRPGVHSDPMTDSSLINTIYGHLESIKLEDPEFDLSEFSQSG